MDSLVARVNDAAAVLRGWQDTDVTAAIDQAVRVYRSFSEAIADPGLLAAVEPSERAVLLLDLASIGAKQVARLTRAAHDGTTSSRAGTQLQEGLGNIVRAAQRELFRGEAAR